jgi:hypothetical protein
LGESLLSRTVWDNAVINLNTATGEILGATLISPITHRQIVSPSGKAEKESDRANCGAETEDEKSPGDHRENVSEKMRSNSDQNAQTKNLSGTHSHHNSETEFEEPPE